MRDERQGWIGFLLGLSFAFLLSVPAPAQPVATLVVEDASADEGQTVSVAVDAQDVQEGIVGIQGSLRFDPAVLNVTHVTFNEAFKVSAFNALNDEGVLRFVGTLVRESEDPIGLLDGTLFTFEAQAVGHPGDSSQLEATFDLVKDIDHQVREVTVQNGTFTIEGQNLLPVADFSFSPQRPNVDEQVTFVDASSDQDGHIVRWLWDFGDGQTLELQTASQEITHGYGQPGPYTVSLTVTDNRDGVGSISKVVQVGPERGGPQLYVFPNPCADRCTFHYRVPEDATRATLRVYNVRGALVRSVELDILLDEFRWDLQDDAGRPSPDGPYFFFMTVQTPTGVRRTPVDVLVIQR